MKRDDIRHMLAGMGILAVVGVMPICASVYWAADTFATKQWTVDRIEPLEVKVTQTESQVREVQLLQVRHTAVLEHLTSVLTELKETLKDMNSGGRA